MSKKKHKALSKKDKAMIRKLIKQAIKHDGLKWCDERLQEKLDIVTAILVRLRKL